MQNKFSSAVIINDCRDENAAARQSARVSSLLGIPTTFVGVSNYNNLAAAGFIVDTLDAFGDQNGVILVNSAPRNGEAKKWENGTPFCYFFVNGSLVVTTVDGYTLSLVKKLKLADEIRIVDVKEVVDFVVEKSLLYQETGDRIKDTQFRSYEFSPRLANWLANGEKIPSKVYSLEYVPQISGAIWFIDNFGNCKTSVLPEEIEFEHGKTVNTDLGKFKCYDRLKDVPNGEKALIIASSGIDNKRFLEIIVQGKSAKKVLDLEEGDRLF